ncbi:MAG: PilN domain-containing protein [Pseudomonadales bacterium]|nr:PilN domain-containing protein [Pseudomonadales bacterium]
MLEKGQNWELFGYDMRRLGRYWIAAWRDLLWAHDSPVRQRLDEVVTVQGAAGVSYYQAGAECAGAPASDCRAVLLPDDLVLAKQIRIPVQAESELTAILDLEIRASSPFTAADTRWGWSVLSRNDAHLEIALAIVSASAAMTFLAREYDSHDPLAQEVWVQVGTSMVVVRGFGESLREQRYRGRLLHTAALVAVVAALLLAMAGVSALFKGAELRRLETMSAATMLQAKDASGLRAVLAQATETINAANEVVARYPNPHTELARLTALLGDEASLSSFSMEGADVRVRGKAADAALVMSNLTDEPGYLEVRAPSAFSRQDNGLEQFTLEFSVAGELPR